MRSVAALVALIALFGLGISTAHAMLPVTGADSFEITLPEGQHRFYHAADQIAADPAAQLYARTLTEELGAGWYIRNWNQYAETPNTIEGSSIVLAPAGLADADAATVETLCRAFIAAHPRLFGTGGDNLVTVRVAHGLNRWGANFRQVENGIPVVGSLVQLAIHDNGRLFGIGARVYRQIDLQLTPTIEPQVARALARSAISFDPTSDLVPGDDALLILPIHRAPGEVEHHLVRRIDVPTAAPYGLWRTYVDAHDGRILKRQNEVQGVYEGNVQGDVEIPGYCDGVTNNIPSVRQYIDIDNVGQATTDDVTGDFAIGDDVGPQAYFTDLRGPWFDVECIDCPNAEITGTIEPNVPESLYWDDSNSRPDERDAFYYANATRLFIESIDPAWEHFAYEVWVNFGSVCNATHSWGQRRLTFYNEGGGCANTARVGDIVAHEFGHGVQGNLLGDGYQGEEGLGEGNSDIAGNFMIDESILGRGFYLDQCEQGLNGRDCENEMRYPEDLTGAIHHDGQIICGFTWHTRANLEATMGPATGETYTANLWHFARKLYMPITQPEQVERYFWIDDDDGNIGNGTPNRDDICQAAERHGFDCTPAPDRVEITHTPLTDRPDPNGPYPVAADFVLYYGGVAQSTIDETEIFYAVNGGPFQGPIAMSNTGGSSYEGLIPTQETGSIIAYYLRGGDVGGPEAFEPRYAPDEYHQFTIGIFQVVEDNPMETTNGWTVGAPGDTAVEGVWVLDDPNHQQTGPLVTQPEDDHTPAPGVNCWITGNPPPGSSVQVEELDGRTSLNSPVYDLATASVVRGSYWAHTLMSETNGDYLDLNMSTDGGATWTTIVHIGERSTPDWRQHEFSISVIDHAFTDQVQFRFVAEDTEPTSHLVEALVDDFRLEALLIGTTTAVDAHAAAPLRLQLGHATPNPFNPSTQIHYSLAEQADVRLMIYDVQGRLIRQLVRDVQRAGEHTVEWNGQDHLGNAASSGIYYYKLIVGDWSQSRPMVLLK